MGKDLIDSNGETPLEISYDEGTLHRVNWDILVGNIPYYGYHYSSNDYCREEWYICKREYVTEEDITSNLISSCKEDMGIRWKIEIEDDPFIKNKWGITELRNAINIKIYRNGKIFYEEINGGRDKAYVLSKAYLKIKDWEASPIEVGTIDFDKNIVGKKVWYKEQPAIISHFCWGDASVEITPDREAGCNEFKIPQNIIFPFDSYLEGYKHAIKVNILDPNLDWFRN